MHAVVYLDPDDPADLDVFAGTLSRELVRMGLGDFTFGLRRDTRLAGRPPLLVIDGGKSPGQPVDLSAAGEPV